MFFIPILNYSRRLPSIVLCCPAVDLRSVDHADEPILVDDTPPMAGDLFDGPYLGRDLEFGKDRNKVKRFVYNAQFMIYM